MTPTSLLCRFQCNKMQCMLHVTCHMSQMLHVTKYQVTNNFIKYPVCHIFLESLCKIQFNGRGKYVLHVLHVTCHTCYMSQISTNKNFTKDPMCHIFLESSCKIQFNGHDKNVACHIFYMSHVTHVTCHKSQVTNNFTNDPVCHIFLESLYKIQFNGHVTCDLFIMTIELDFAWAFQKYMMHWVFSKNFFICDI